MIENSELLHPHVIGYLIEMTFPLVSEPLGFNANCVNYGEPSAGGRLNRLSRSLTPVHSRSKSEGVESNFTVALVSS